jgi:hypothetical protein
MLGGSGCCNSGGAKKRVARKSVGKPKAKPKAKRGGNAGDAGDAGDSVADPAVVAETQTREIENLYPENSGDAQAGGARKKKGSKVAAKKALSPYNKFVKKHFAILKKQFPDEKAPQIMQKVAIEWNKTKK